MEARDLECWGVFPKDRAAMTGLTGLLSMSSTGAKFKFTPSEASSIPMAPPTPSALSPHERAYENRVIGGDVRQTRPP